MRKVLTVSGETPRRRGTRAPARSADFNCAESTASPLVDVDELSRRPPLLRRCAPLRRRELALGQRNPAWSHRAHRLRKAERVHLHDEGEDVAFSCSRAVIVAVGALTEKLPVFSLWNGHRPCSSAAGLAQLQVLAHDADDVHLLLDGLAKSSAICLGSRRQVRGSRYWLLYARYECSGSQGWGHPQLTNDKRESRGPCEAEIQAVSGRRRPFLAVEGERAVPAACRMRRRWCE